MHAGQTDHHIPTEAMIESATGCTATQVAEMQENVSSALDHDTGAISAVRVLHLYLERLLINQFDVRDPPPPHTHLPIFLYHSFPTFTVTRTPPWADLVAIKDCETGDEWTALQQFNVSKG